VTIFGIRIITAKQYAVDLAVAQQVGENVGRLAARLDDVCEVERAVGMAESYTPRRRWPVNRTRHLHVVR